MDAQEVLPRDKSPNKNKHVGEPSTSSDRRHSDQSMSSTIDVSVTADPDDTVSDPVRETESATSLRPPLPTAADWEHQREAIRELYKDRNMKLKDVMRIMETEHDFVATEGMYKKKIDQWGLDKKLKRQELIAIIYLLRQREQQGKESAFFLRGQEVDLEAVTRAYKRRRAAINNALTIGNHDFDYQKLRIECVTPPPTATADLPTNPLQKSELLLHDFSIYVRGLCEATYHDAASFNELMREDTVSGRMYGVSIGTAIMMSKQPNWIEVGRHFRDASRHAEALADSNSITDIIILLRGITLLRKVEELVQFANALAKHLDNYANLRLSRNGPRIKLVQRILQSSDDDCLEVLSRLGQVTAAAISSINPNATLMEQLWTWMLRFYDVMCQCDQNDREIVREWAEESLLYFTQHCHSLSELKKDFFTRFLFYLTCLKTDDPAKDIAEQQVSNLTPKIRLLFESFSTTQVQPITRSTPPPEWEKHALMVAEFFRLAWEHALHVAFDRPRHDMFLVNRLSIGKGLRSCAVQLGVALAAAIQQTQEDAALRER